MFISQLKQRLVGGVANHELPPNLTLLLRRVRVMVLGRELVATSNCYDVFAPWAAVQPRIGCNSAGFVGDVKGSVCAFSKAGSAFFVD